MKIDFVFTFDHIEALLLEQGCLSLSMLQSRRELGGVVIRTWYCICHVEIRHTDIVTPYIYAYQLDKSYRPSVKMGPTWRYFSPLPTSPSSSSPDWLQYIATDIGAAAREIVLGL